MYSNFDVDRDKEECSEGKLKLEAVLLNALFSQERINLKVSFKKLYYLTLEFFIFKASGKLDICLNIKCPD